MVDRDKLLAARENQTFSPPLAAAIVDIGFGVLRRGKLFFTIAETISTHAFALQRRH